MAKNTSIVVLFNDTPVEGARIMAGDLTSEWKVTDATGTVTVQTDDDFVACLPIGIRDTGSGRDVIINKIVESGDTIVVRINKITPPA